MLETFFSLHGGAFCLYGETVSLRGEADRSRSPKHKPTFTV
ncbi:hypothetical protein [Pseudanabaena sp. PCC 6802]|nr:hypothetical protein [Pseudanabaena sp. PCC 6802]